MTENTQGLIPGLQNTEVSTDTSDDNFDSIVESQNYLQRVQLFGSNSKLVQKAKIRQGVFGLPARDDAEDIGDTFNCIPIDYRYKAVDTSGDNPISNFDPNTDTFKDIKERSYVQDSGCLFGIEFLLWMPDLNKFVTYFFSSKSTRPEAKMAKARINKAATFNVKLVEGKKYSWHVPVVVECDIAFKNLPDTELLTETMDKFKNPESDEKADAVDDGR